MSDDFNDLRTSLKQAAEAFRPDLDASALAGTSRARSRRRMIIGALAGALAVAVVAVLAFPGVLALRAMVPAAPAPASAPPSVPTSDPTRPSSNGAGNNGANQFEAMTMPVAGAVVPDGSWKMLTMPTANLELRYPSNWTVREGEWGITWIMAPSGYTIEVNTNRLQEPCDDGAAATDPKIATTDLVAVTALGKGAVVIRWHGGGASPVSINLAQHSGTKACWQKFLNYAGVDDIYVGSGDNVANPTVEELDQAVAILASASNVH
jgi:hypothetical protein